jgi:hypothetical protein
MTQTKTPEGGHSDPLNGGLENSPSVTHETELGRLPAHWQVVPLREANSSAQLRVHAFDVPEPTSVHRNRCTMSNEPQSQFLLYQTSDGQTRL